jgi:hypothetical protein
MVLLEASPPPSDHEARGYRGPQAKDPDGRKAAEREDDAPQRGPGGRPELVAAGEQAVGGGAGLAGQLRCQGPWDWLKTRQ